MLAKLAMTAVRLTPMGCGATMVKVGDATVGSRVADSVTGASVTGV